MQATPHDTINTMYYLCITTSRSVLLHHCTWEYTNTECTHNILYLSLMHCMLCIQRAWRVYYRTTHYMHGVHGVHAVVCMYVYITTRLRMQCYACTCTVCVTLTHPLYYTIYCVSTHVYTCTCMYVCICMHILSLQHVCMQRCTVYLGVSPHTTMHYVHSVYHHTMDTNPLSSVKHLYILRRV